MMKHLKMLLGVTVLTGSMILVGCGESTESKKEEVASTQVTQETETVDTKKEETIEVLGLDGERAEMDGYSIGLLPGQGARRGLDALVVSSCNGTRIAPPSW